MAVAAVSMVAAVNVTVPIVVGMAAAMTMSMVVPESVTMPVTVSTAARRDVK